MRHGRDLWAPREWFTLLRKTLIYSHGEAKKILISSIRTITQNNLSIDNTYTVFIRADRRRSCHSHGWKRARDHYGARCV